MVARCQVEGPLRMPYVFRFRARELRVHIRHALPACHPLRSCARLMPKHARKDL